MLDDYGKHKGGGDGGDGRKSKKVNKKIKKKNKENIFHGWLQFKE